MQRETNGKVMKKIIGLAIVLVMGIVMMGCVSGDPSYKKNTGLSKHNVSVVSKAGRGYCK